MKIANHFGLITMMINEGIIIPEKTSIRSTSISVPIGIYTQKIFAKKSTMQSIAMAIASNLQREVTTVAGIGFDGIPIAYEVSGYSQKRFTPVQTHDTGNLAGFKEKLPLNKEVVALITGEIGTGDDCRDAIRVLERAGAQVAGIFSVFDYGIRSRYSLQKEIRSLATMAELEGHMGESQDMKISTWLNQNKGLLRKEESAALLV